MAFKEAVRCGLDVFYLLQFTFDGALGDITKLYEMVRDLNTQKDTLERFL